MSYKTRRYRQGLSGEKPGWIVLDKQGHRAQEAGYRDHLRNKDLADRIREGSETGSGDWSGSSYESSSSEPLAWWQRIVWLAVSFTLLRWAFLAAVWFAHKGSNFTSFDFWFTFALGLLIVPGLVLFWPGLWLLIFALSDW
jgi:hypothetical protein